MKFIQGFDCLRGISIIFVVLNHLGLYMQLPSNHLFQERIWPLFSGLTGVQIFFCLSGFLITGILIKEISTKKKINLKIFYTKRALRLLPALFIFFLMILFCMKLGLMPVDKTGVLYGIFYFYNFIPRHLYSGQLGHLWSLALEEQFYLFLPILLLFIRNAKRLLIVVGLIIILCFACYFILPLIYVGTPPFGNYLDKYFLIDRWFIPAGAPIMLGAAAAVLVFGTIEFKNLFSLNRKHEMFFFSFLLFLSPLYLPRFLLPAVSIIQSLGITLLLCIIYFNQSGNLLRILNFKPLAYLGKISYGLYIYQGFFLRTGPSEQHAMQVQHFPVNIFLAILMAVISFELIEKPILRLKSRL